MSVIFQNVYFSKRKTKMKMKTGKIFDFFILEPDKD